MQIGVKSSNLGVLGIVGVFLAVAGALLDFYSGYLILAQSAMTTNDIGMVIPQYAPSALGWGAGILVLGVVLLVTALAIVTSFGMGRMKTLGALMALYGILMLFIGVSMYWGVTPMMQRAALPGLGMLVVGALMVFNGAVMRGPRTVVTRNASLVIVGVIVLVAAALVAGPSLIQGPNSGGMETTSTRTTSTQSSISGLAKVAVGSASCSGSGTTEECSMTFTNSGSTGTSITGAGSLSYSGAGAMGMDTVTTSTGCTALTGSLGPGQTQQVRCRFTVSGLPASGTQVTGTVALNDGGSVSFSGTAS
jgi:hypothetical protein